MFAKLKSFFGMGGKEHAGAKASAGDGEIIRELSQYLSGRMGTLQEFGPQLVMGFHGLGVAQAIASNLPGEVKGWVSRDAQALRFADGISALHLYLKSPEYIRRAMERLLHAKYGADLADYGLTSCSIAGVCTVGGPQSDVEYMIGHYSSTGQGLVVQDFAIWG